MSDVLFPHAENRNFNGLEKNSSLKKLKLWLSKRHPTFLLAVIIQYLSLHLEFGPLNVDSVVGGDVLFTLYPCLGGLAPHLLAKVLLGNLVFQLLLKSTEAVVEVRLNLDKMMVLGVVFENH